MGTHPRLRKAAKWGGLGLAGVSLALLPVSALWRSSVRVSTRPKTKLVLAAGVVGVSWTYAPLKSNTAVWKAERRLAERETGGPTELLWLPVFDVGSTSGGAAVPLWLLAVAGGTVTIWARRSLHRRSAALSLCPACGYDRSTLPAGTPCPECGAGGGRLVP